MRQGRLAHLTTPSMCTMNALYQGRFYSFPPRITLGLLSSTTPLSQPLILHSIIIYPRLLMIFLGKYKVQDYFIEFIRHIHVYKMSGILKNDQFAIRLSFVPLFNYS